MSFKILLSFIFVLFTTFPALAQISLSKKFDPGTIFDGRVPDWPFINSMSPEPVLDFGTIKPVGSGEIWLLVGKGRDLLYIVLSDVQSDLSGFGSYGGYPVKLRARTETIFHQYTDASPFGDDTPYIEQRTRIRYNPLPEAVLSTEDGIDIAQAARMTGVGTSPQPMIERVDFVSYPSRGLISHIQQIYDYQGNLLVEEFKGGIYDQSLISSGGGGLTCEELGEASKGDVANIIENYSHLALGAAILESEYGSSIISAAVGAVVGSKIPSAGAGTGALAGAAGAKTTVAKASVDFFKMTNGAAQVAHTEVLGTFVKAFIEAECESREANGPISVQLENFLELVKNPAPLLPGWLPEPVCLNYSSGSQTGEIDEAGDVIVTFTQGKCQEYGVVLVPIEM